MLEDPVFSGIPPCYISNRFEIEIGVEIKIAALGAIETCLIRNMGAFGRIQYLLAIVSRNMLHAVPNVLFRSRKTEDKLYLKDKRRVFWSKKKNFNAE